MRPLAQIAATVVTSALIAAGLAAPAHAESPAPPVKDPTIWATDIQTTQELAGGCPGDVHYLGSVTLTLQGNNPDGSPASNTDLWAALSNKPDAAYPPTDPLFARTDAEGKASFTFPDLHSGSYWLSAGLLGIPNTEPILDSERVYVSALTADPIATLVLSSEPLAGGAAYQVWAETYFCGESMSGAQYDVPAPAQLVQSSYYGDPVVIYSNEAASVTVKAASHIGMGGYSQIKLDFPVVRPEAAIDGKQVTGKVYQKTEGVLLTLPAGSATSSVKVSLDHCPDGVLYDGC
ncbi:MAG: DUF4198 domain-containing protein, partial [Propionibacteriaceae bacterium]|nr:DUF4198 domain-containing protein [Propionibacteriaceae bacterium]